MRSFAARSVLACAAALFVMASSPPVRTTPRVVLVTLDAAREDAAAMARTGPAQGGFARIAERGLVAERLLPANVASTPVSHATLFSGAWPARHGVIGVSHPGARIDAAPVSGFTVRTDVPRIWNLLKAAGKRVTCAAAPGADDTSPATACTDTLPYAAMNTPDASGSDRFGRFALELLKKVGPSPGEPRARPANMGDIPERAFAAAAYDYATFQSRLILDQLRRDDWDLLIAYLPILDNLLHRFLVTDPRQADDADAALRAEFAGYVKEGYRLVDSLLLEWLRAAPETVFLIAGDHGMVATHSTVLLSNLLADAGLKVGGPQADVRVFSSGASAHVYVNTSTRFAGGALDARSAAPIIETIVRTAQRFADPVTGEPVFRTVATSSGIAALDLGHPNAGDVFVATRGGWAVAGHYAPGAGPVVPNTLHPRTRMRVARSDAQRQLLERGNLNDLSAGVHGHTNDVPDVAAYFGMIGPGVERRALGTVSLVDVVPTILELLGVARPADLPGRSLLQR